MRVNLWDLAGPTEYIEVRNEFYKDAQGSILVYDVTNRASFEALELWLDESKRFGATDMVSFWSHRPCYKVCSMVYELSLYC